MSDEEFDDVEVQRILERALDQQKSAERRALVKGTGTSLPELRTIASEVGIDPRFIDSAAREVVVRRGAPPAKERFGVPDLLRADRVIPEEIDDEEWMRIVEEMRAAFGMTGVVSSYARVREWHSGTSSAKEASIIQLRVETTDAGTAITLSQNTRQQTLLPTVLGMTFGAVAVTFAALVPFIGASTSAAAFIGVNALGGAGIFAGGMGWVGRWARSRGELFERLLDRIELIAGTAERGT